MLIYKSATSKGYEVATEEDSINFTHPDSKTRRGRVGKKVAQTLDTNCQQGVIDDYKIRRLTPRECFRLQDFPDLFEFIVSDTQLYKQAGNSITVRVLEINNQKTKSIMNKSINTTEQIREMNLLCYQFKRFLRQPEIGIKLYLFDSNIEGFEVWFKAWLKAHKGINDLDKHIENIALNRSRKSVYLKVGTVKQNIINR